MRLQRAVAPAGAALGPQEVAELVLAALEQQVAGERVLVLVPDRTRRLQLPMVLGAVRRALHRAATVEVLVALGTHPPLPADDLRSWTGTAGSDAGTPTVSNHAWDDPEQLATLGTVDAKRLRQIAGDRWHPSLGGDLTIRVNRAAVTADRLVIVAPTLPHEVAGFSGGAKYLFPGIGGPEMIDVMHWLGALGGVSSTIGVAHTPVRALIDEAAALLATPVTLVAVVTEGDAVAALDVGDLGDAWASSVAVAAERHVVWHDRPYRRVLSYALDIYDELWTGAKAVYKLEPVVADGGELVVVAPGVAEVSRTHGRLIEQVGYHVLPYFLQQWDRVAGVPLAVVAHSTHVKGAGRYDDGRELPRIEVALATGIPADRCRRLNLGFVDPAGLRRRLRSADHDTLVVHGSGEVLHRLRPQRRSP